MPSIAWFHSSADPSASGELRRLALPALLVEQGDWVSYFRSTAVGKPCQIAVLPASAINLLPQVSDWDTSAAILLDLDDETVHRDAPLLDNIHLATGRIDTVITRGPLSARWAAANLASHVATTHIADLAERDAELRAAALRFNLAQDRITLPPEPQGHLWFAEPGDFVSDEEASLVLRAARDIAAAGRSIHLVAPRPVLDWLEQLRFPPGTRRTIWQPGCLDGLLRQPPQIILPVLETTLRRHAKLSRHGFAAADIAPETLTEFQPAAVGAKWEALLRLHLRPKSVAATEGHLLLVFIDLIQDLELVLPILEAVRASGKFRLRVATTGFLLEEFPRVERELQVRGFVPEIYDRQLVAKGFGISLHGVEAVLTMVETSLDVHRRAHLLTLRAQSLGIPTFTLQHGLENVGLTYFDEEHDRSVDIHSDYIFAWFPAEDVPHLVPDKVRPRLIHVGRPRMAAQGERVHLPITEHARVIAVFENLHWTRYSAQFRKSFMDHCFELARALDDTVIVLKPHPAGQWAAKARDTFQDWPANVVLADPRVPGWSGVSAADLIATADAVITTPSSVAADAAFHGKRVAVVGYDLDVSLYAPLPVLRNFQDWLGFAVSPDNEIRAARGRARFLGRINISGPSEDRIVAAIDNVLGGRLLRQVQ